MFFFAFSEKLTSNYSVGIFLLHREFDKMTNILNIEKQTDKHTCIGTKRYKADAQINTGTGGVDRQNWKQTDRKTDRHKERQTERHTDR